MSMGAFSLDKRWEIGGGWQRAMQSKDRESS